MYKRLHRPYIKIFSNSFALFFQYHESEFHLIMVLSSENKIIRLCATPDTTVKFVDFIHKKLKEVLVIFWHNAIWGNMVGMLSSLDYKYRSMSRR